MPEAYDDPDVYKVSDEVVCPTLANLKLQVGSMRTGDYNVAILIGNAAAFDQASKRYVWDAELTTAGNDTTIVQPTAITGSSPGRWRCP